MFFWFIFYMFQQSSKTDSWNFNLVLWGDRTNRWSTVSSINKEVLFASQRLRLRPMRLYPSASVFVSASSQKFFHSGTAALLQKSSVNLWSCRSKTAAFKSTERSPLRLSNAFTRKSPIYKACAHLQTHTSPPYYIWHWTMRGRTVVRISSSPNPLNPICEYGYRGEGCFSAMLYELYRMRHMGLWPHFLLDEDSYVLEK